MIFQFQAYSCSYAVVACGDSFDRIACYAPSMQFDRDHDSGLHFQAKRIENGVYLGPLGCLTFEGRFSWKKRILAFIFECIRIKIGPFGPLQISLGKGEEREPSTKDPFFTWFYVDEEIAVAQGRGGGTAFWCRCRRVT